MLSYSTVSGIFLHWPHGVLLFFSAYLLIPSKELLAKSITPLVGLVTTPTRPFPIPETGNSKIKLRFECWQEIFTSMRIWQTFQQTWLLKLVFNDSNVQSFRTFEETFHTFLLSALYWFSDNSCNSIKNSLPKDNFSFRQCTSS